MSTFIMGSIRELGHSPEVRQPIEAPVKGMMVNVYRTNYDCTNGGVTSVADRVLLIGKDIPEIFTAKEGDPVLKLKTHMDGWIAEPVGPMKPGHVGWMMGGNFVHTCDSRMPFRYPVPVHDRQESMELYNSNFN